MVAGGHDEAGDESDAPEGHEHTKDGIFQGNGAFVASRAPTITSVNTQQFREWGFINPSDSTLSGDAFATGMSC